MFSQREANIYIMAARYAHTRPTGAALNVVEEILRNWTKFTDSQKEQIIKEASEATCNFSDWERIKDKL